MSKCVMLIQDKNGEVLRTRTGRYTHAHNNLNIRDLMDFLDHFTCYGKYTLSNITEDEYDDEVEVELKITIDKCDDIRLSLQHQQAQRVWQEDAVSKLAYKRLHNEMDEMYTHNDNAISKSWEYLHTVSSNPDLAREYIEKVKKEMDDE